MPRRSLLLVAGLVLLVGCSKPSSHAFTTQTSTTQGPVAIGPPVLPLPPPEPIFFTGFSFDLHAASDKAEGKSFDAAWAGVLETLNRYLEAAILTPLRTGGPAGDLRPMFTKPAGDLAMTNGPDRFALIDENLPPVSDVRKEAAMAGLTGLAGADGIMSVVTAGLDLKLIGHIAGAPVTVVRTGELVFVPEGGTWLIDAYDVKVTRTIAEDSMTTTTRS
jgi:hypothetical protein